MTRKRILLCALAALLCLMTANGAASAQEAGGIMYTEGLVPIPLDEDIELEDLPPELRQKLKELTLPEYDPEAPGNDTQPWVLAWIRLSVILDVLNDQLGQLLDALDDFRRLQDEIAYLEILYFFDLEMHDYTYQAPAILLELLEKEAEIKQKWAEIMRLYREIREVTIPEYERARRDEERTANGESPSGGSVTTPVRPK